MWYNEKEQNGVDMSKMPVILFSNKVAACGFGFYNDFDSEAVLKNSKAYDFIQANTDAGSSTAPAAATTEVAKSEKAVPQF